jgi:hypothetical protein
LYKKKEKNDIFCLFEVKVATHREFHCDISLYICIITPIGLSPLFFFILR